MVARITNLLSESLNNKFNLVLHVFWCVAVMVTTVAIPNKEIVEIRDNMPSYWFSPMKVAAFGRKMYEIWFFLPSYRECINN